MSERVSHSNIVIYVFNLHNIRFCCDCIQFILWFHVFAHPHPSLICVYVLFLSVRICCRLNLFLYSLYVTRRISFMICLLSIKWTRLCFCPIDFCHRHRRTNGDFSRIGGHRSGKIDCRTSRGNLFLFSPFCFCEIEFVSVMLA